MKLQALKPFRASRLTLSLLVASMFIPLVGSAPLAFGQTQSVSASPGYINLGMVTSINVTAPAAGTYTVVVVKPSGAKADLNLTFANAGETQGAIFGNSTLGFNSVVDEPGTYSVFVEQGGQVVSSTSFYATNQLVISMDFVDGGLCNYIQVATRGSKMFPRFFVTYGSNGAPVTNAYLKDVVYTLPGGALANATWHRPGAEGVGFFIGLVAPNWNFTAVGPYYPNATATDSFGNTVTYHYKGRPFEIIPAQLVTDTWFVDGKTNQTVTSLYSGEAVVLNANVTYSAKTIAGTEVLSGFVSPLDSARGGSVTAKVGWGFYNATTSAFGGTNAAGGLLGTVDLTYSASTGLWTAPFNVAPLPGNATGYKVVVAATDQVSPPNTGSAVINLAPAAAAGAGTTTTTLGGNITLSLALITAIATLIVGLVAGIVVRPIREKSDSR